MQASSVKSASAIAASAGAGHTPGMEATRTWPGGPLLARTLWAVGMLLAAGEAALIIATWGSPHMFFGGLPPVQLVGAVAMITIALLVSTRVPGNRVAWLFFVVGFSNLTTDVAALYAIRGIEVAPGSLPAVAAVTWFGTWSWTGQVFGLSLLVQLFPDGRPLSPRWRPLAWVTAAGGATLVVTDALLAIPRQGWHLDTHGEVAIGRMPAGIGLLFLALVVTMLLAGVEAGLRLRRARGLERQQLRWFAAAGAVLVVCVAVLIVMVVINLPDAQVQPAASALSVSVVLLVLAMGLAVLRYRLYDIDIVINRAVVYGGLAVAITAVYLGLIAGVGSIVGSRANLGLAVVATAIVSLAFQPARARLQRYANRLVYGKRATPYEVLSQFSERVAESMATEDLPARMAGVLGEATAAVRADVWLRVGDQLRPQAAWPPSAPALAPLPVTGQLVPAIPGADRAEPVRHQGELLGVLSVAKRPGDVITPIEEKLMVDLAHQAGLVLRNVHLTAELLDRLDELRASRQRLVQAQDEERRRIERNLHDGAQQHLVALKVKLGLAELLAKKDPDKAQATIAELKADADEALETLRDLARGIYPPLLADKGLVAALEAHARKATVPVTVEGVDVGRYRQNIEAAIYFCCLEAIQNVQKYARASHVVVKLSDAPPPNPPPASGGRILYFEVDDDGAGFDAATVARGAGLGNMADRLDALGGHLAVDSAPGRGTRVRGTLPVTAAELT